MRSAGLENRGTADLAVCATLVVAQSRWPETYDFGFVLVLVVVRVLENKGKFEDEDENDHEDEADRVVSSQTLITTTRGFHYVRFD